MRRFLTPTLLVALFLAAGCGGEEESSSKAWANDFCSAAADWRSSLEEIVSQFQNPSDLNADSIQGALDDGLEATETFVDDVDSLGPPETEARQEAASILDSMTSSIRTTADELRSTLEGADSLQDLVGQAGQAASQIGQLEQELQSSLDQLENLDTGELKGELESNDDCDTARSGAD
jgi:methyl-accepting chemotaxis protein